MANTAKLTVTVRSARGSSNITVSTNGRYVSMPANTIGYTLSGQPVQPSSSAEAFWASVLAAVSSTIASH